MTQPHLNYDIAIIGGGPVGAALALALRGSGLAICLLEARPNMPSQDARALALSYGSRLLLDKLHVWRTLQQVSPIRTIHISQRQSFGRAKLQAANLHVPELGYVLPYATLQDGLDAALQESDVKTIYLARVLQLRGEADHAVIQYQRAGEAETTLSARLAVVADGGKLLAEPYPPTFHDYGQSAVIAHVTAATPLLDTAFERFTPQGPVALLPYQDGYELVWTAPHERAQAMLAWDDATFLGELHQHFGGRVGAFVSVGKRTSFPLGLKRAPQLTPMPHTVLLGNAAQTLHPVAGQGFNMGVRDAWELAQVILDSDPEAIGTETMLAAYRASRSMDRNAGIRFTDSLVRIFSNDIPALRPARAAALSALDCLPMAKQFVGRRMMFGANG
ncbi:MAG: FAD-dependent monooxygenase [Gallionella sp.]